jgi:hypothetical protein
MASFLMIEIHREVYVLAIAALDKGAADDFVGKI